MFRTSFLFHNFRRRHLNSSLMKSMHINKMNRFCIFDTPFEFRSTPITYTFIGSWIFLWSVGFPRANVSSFLFMIDRNGRQVSTPSSRLLSSFLHYDLTHLLSNSFSAFFMGRALEFQMKNSFRFAGIFFIGTILSTYAISNDKAEISALLGASAGIYSWIGALTVLYPKMWFVSGLIPIWPITLGLVVVEIISHLNSVRRNKVDRVVVGHTSHIAGYTGGAIAALILKRYFMFKKVL